MTAMKGTRTVVQSAVLISLALALSYVERFIPLQLIIPLPGVKLGIANVVTLVSLYLLGWKRTLPIVLIRCLLGSLFGNITGLLFSLTGGILAFLVMTLCKNMRLFSIYGISVLGAAAHSVGQILAATCIMGSVYIFAYLPYLLFIGIFTGTAIGAACAGVLHALSLAGASKFVNK